MKVELFKNVPQTPKRDWQDSTKALFKICCEDLVRRGRLWPASLHLVYVYCDSFNIYEIVTKQINEDTANLVKTDRDTTRKSTLFQIRKTAVDEMKTYEQRLGFSPYYSDRITEAPNSNEVDPIDLI